MRVSEVMTEATLTDAPGATLAEAARKMWEQQAGSLLVMDGDQLVGIVTERDVLRGVASGLPLADTAPVWTRRPDQGSDRAADRSAFWATGIRERVLC